MSNPNNPFSPRRSTGTRATFLLARKGRFEAQLGDLEESKNASVQRSTELTQEKKDVRNLISTKSLQVQGLQEEIAILEENEAEVDYQQKREKSKIGQYSLSSMCARTQSRDPVGQC